VKPGYVNDPTRAVFDHVWLIGDDNTISTAFQAQVDELVDLVRVRSGTGASVALPPRSPAHQPAKPTKP
jgi:hypothetical protein